MTPTNLNGYSDALVVLGTAGVVVPLVRRFGLSPVLGYLGAGAVLGPLGLGSLVGSAPALYWVTITEAKNVDSLAELGVVFLLFLIGLELSLSRLMAMRRLVFGLGALQIAVSAAAIAAIVALFGQNLNTSIIFGLCLSLSSTAIVLELLSQQGRLSTTVGRTSFAVLLAQDLAVIPILMFISITGAGAHGSVLASAGRALAQATVAIAIIVVVGRFLLRPLFRLVADARSSELFIAAVLFVIIGAGVIASQEGLSMALGAFVAGLMLAETEFGRAIRATVEPFKGLLLGLFFFTVGMAIDFRELAREPLVFLAAIGGLIGVKTLIVSGLGRLFRLPWISSLETGLLLGPGGEFAFVGIGLAASLKLITPAASSFALAATSVTMALTPLLAVGATRLRILVEGKQKLGPELTARPEVDERHAIVIGFGRVGRVVCDLLKEHGIAYIATDSDAALVTRDRRNGASDLYYGDAVSAEFLISCGLMNASGVVITIGDRDAVGEIVGQVRALRPDILIVARAHDADHARYLYELGATDAVPETIEASLQLSEASLVGLGTAMGPVIASIHEKRDVFRRELQGAAQRAGQAEFRGLRSKRLRAE